MVLFLGVTRARAVAAPLNAAYTEEEFKFYLDDAQSVLLLLPAEGGSPKAAAAAAGLKIPIAYSSALTPQVRASTQTTPSSAATAGTPEGLRKSTVTVLTGGLQFQHQERSQLLLTLSFC